MITGPFEYIRIDEFLKKKNFHIHLTELKWMFGLKWLDHNHKSAYSSVSSNVDTTSKKGSDLTNLQARKCPNLNNSDLVRNVYFVIFPNVTGFGSNK